MVDCTLIVIKELGRIKSFLFLFSFLLLLFLCLFLFLFSFFLLFLFLRNYFFRGLWHWILFLAFFIILLFIILILIILIILSIWGVGRDIISVLQVLLHINWWMRTCIFALIKKRVPSSGISKSSSSSSPLYESSSTYSSTYWLGLTFFLSLINIDNKSLDIEGN